MNLIKIRVTAFGYEALTLALLGIVGVFTEGTINALVTEHFGETAISSIVALVLIGAMKHIRNLKIIKSEQLGGKRGQVII